MIATKNNSNKREASHQKLNGVQSREEASGQIPHKMAAFISQKWFYIFSDANGRFTNGSILVSFKINYLQGFIVFHPISIF